MRKLLLSFTMFTLIGGSAQAQCCYDAFGLFQLIESWEEGGVEVKFTTIDGNFVPIYGLKGGWFLGGERTLIGVTGNFSYTNWTELSTMPTNFTMAYGGMYLDVNQSPYQPMHINYNLTVGLGSAEIDGEQASQRGSVLFLLIEPNVYLKMRLGSWIKFGVGGGYRYTTGPGTSNLSTTDLNGPSLNLMLMFGSYD